jgi:hypothetical protein
MNHPNLHSAIDSSEPCKMDQLLDGSFLDLHDQSELNDNERT